MTQIAIRPEPTETTGTPPPPSGAHQGQHDAGFSPATPACAAAPAAQRAPRRPRLRLRALLRPAGAGLRPRRHPRAPQPRGARRPRRHHLALGRAAARHRAAHRRPARRPVAARRGAAPGCPPRSGQAVGQGRLAQPHALVQGSPSSAVAAARATAVGLPHAGLRLDRQPLSGRGRGRRCPRPARCRLHPGRPRAGQDRPGSSARRHRRARRRSL